MPKALVWKAWTIGNYKTFEELQKLYSDESSEHDIVINDQNTIVNVITKVENSSDLIQHYLAPDNIYADSEFDDNNVFKWAEFVYVASFIVLNKYL